MELDWSRQSDGSYTAKGVEEDSEQEVTLVIKKDDIAPGRPWTLRVSNDEVTGGLVGRQSTLRGAKKLAGIYCTLGLDIEPE